MDASYPPIAHYAVVGDCHSAVLVSRDGSIDWFCPTGFDRPAVFCRLLDRRTGGFASLAPTRPFRSERGYRGATNVLEAEFATADGRVRLTDLMPVEPRPASPRGHEVGTRDRLLRLVEGLAGEVELELRFRPTFDYARGDTAIEVSEGRAVARAGPARLTVACEGLRLEPDPEGGVTGRLPIRAGERRWVALDYAEGGHARRGPDPPACERQLAETLDFWERWAATCSYRGPYRAQVLRSALALKLLTYEPTGAIVAAPTTSLPEAIGGQRNWDYRFTWLRDAALILYALMTIDYQEEAADFFAWLRRAEEADPKPELQIMYRVDGGLELPEETLDHLEGYRGSRPVRVGNAAVDQKQLDVYGEVLTAARLHFAGCASDRHAPRAPTEREWQLLAGLVEQAAARWTEADQGIWEVRGGPRHFLYSKLLCWAALDAGIRLAADHALPAPLARWRGEREAVRRAILERGYDAERGAFTQAFGSPALDASALAIPRLGFLPPTDPRVQSTVERIREELVANGLVYRYLTEDGVPGGEATFAICSFWLVDVLALSGRLDEAHALFERVCGYANDLGLLAEEIDPHSGELLGNFPQGFTHLALIRAAVNLAKAAKHGPEEAPETEADRAAPARRAADEGHPGPRRART